MAQGSWPRTELSQLSLTHSSRRQNLSSAANQPRRPGDPREDSEATSLVSDAESVEVLAIGVEVVRAVERVVPEPLQPIEGWPRRAQLLHPKLPILSANIPGPVVDLLKERATLRRRKSGCAPARRSWILAADAPNATKYVHELVGVIKSKCGDDPRILSPPRGRFDFE